MKKIRVNLLQDFDIYSEAYFIRNTGYNGILNSRTIVKLRYPGEVRCIAGSELILFWLWIWYGFQALVRCGLFHCILVSGA